MSNTEELDFAGMYGNDLALKEGGGMSNLTKVGIFVFERYGSQLNPMAEVSTNCARVLGKLISDLSDEHDRCLVPYFTLPIEFSDEPEFELGRVEGGAMCYRLLNKLSGELYREMYVVYHKDDGRVSVMAFDYAPKNEEEKRKVVGGIYALVDLQDFDDLARLSANDLSVKPGWGNIFDESNSPDNWVVTKIENLNQQ